MTVPRPLRPFVRTRARIAASLALLLAGTAAAAGVAWWPSPAENTQAAPVTPRDQPTALAEAKRTGADVLIDTATTATEQTWARPDGQLRTSVYALPQRARTAGGDWAPIDTTLARDPSGPFVQPANPVFRVRFSAGPVAGGASASSTVDEGTGGQGGGDGGDSVLAEAYIDGHLIKYTWPGPLPEPVLDGPKALYQEVVAGVDLLMVARAEGGFSQLLIVKSPAGAAHAAVRNPTYGLESETAAFRLDSDTGSVRVIDRATDEQISHIPTPFAWDSSGRDPELPPDSPASTATGTPAEVLRLSGLTGIEAGARSAPLPIRLDGDGTGKAELRLDAATTGLLTDPETRYPVFLDPTLTSGRQAWTLVQKLHPNSNFFNGTNYNKGTSEARVGHEDDSNGTARSFWRMGYSSSLKGAKISSAKFRVLNTHSWNCTTRQHQLFMTGAISTGTTWNKQPDWTKELQRKSFAYGYNGSCDDDYVDFNVAVAAQLAADKGQSSITLGMRATSENDKLTWRKFTASSAELEVVYNRPPREPTGGTSTPGGACNNASPVTVARTDIVLAANASDPDGNLKALRFRVWRHGTTAPAGTAVTTNSSGKATHTVARADLVDGAVYYWNVRAEDTSNEPSTYYPGGGSCRLLIDGSAPPAPEVTSTDFPEATEDGATWAKIKFGRTGRIDFSATGAVKFGYTFNNGVLKEVPAVAGKGGDTIAPPHAGPLWIHVYAFDAAGNRSVATPYITYVPPRDLADGPHDVGGDGMPDLLIVDAGGVLRSYPGAPGGDLYGGLAGAYRGNGNFDLPGHWVHPTTGAAALITKHSDVYPGDGHTDLFARTPDGGFWLYPGDGYGSFNVDKRLSVMLPAGTPAPAQWTQIKALGDITGDKRPDLAVRTGTQFWILSGYTGGAFQQATLMEGSSWARQEIVNIADVDLDGTPDLTFRNLDSGALLLRSGKPGGVTGSVDLNSLKTAAASRRGSDAAYGSGWTAAAINAIVGTADVNGDRVPDIWARLSNGEVRAYTMSATNGGTWILALSGNNNGYKAMG